MSWFFDDEADEYADAVLARLQVCPAIVPAIWPLEVGNVLVVAERRQRLTGADVARVVQLIANLPVTVEQESPQRMLGEVVDTARTYALSTYDASYLDLAMRLAAPIATADKALRHAAIASEVPIYLVGD